MRIESVALVGAGGHAMVVLDAMTSLNWPSGKISVLTEDASQAGDNLLGQSISLLTEADLAESVFHVCIGENEVRQRLFLELAESAKDPLTIVHPAATISQYALVGAGSFVAAMAILAPGCQIGQSCIINHGSVVDHESKIGAFVHVSPGATLAGCVTIGDGVLVGAGATVLPGVKIGNGAVVGAGAVVRENVPAGSVYAGVPARRIR